MRNTQLFRILPKLLVNCNKTKGRLYAVNVGEYYPLNIYCILRIASSPLRIL